MALEQSLNRDVKSSGGLSRINKKEAARDRWFVNNHVRALISAKVSAMCHISKSTTHGHKEDSIARTKSDEKCVKIVMDAIKSKKHPFVITRIDEIEPLSNIASGIKPAPTNSEKICRGL